MKEFKYSSGMRTLHIGWHGIQVPFRGPQVNEETGEIEEDKYQIFDPMEEIKKQIEPLIQFNDFVGEITISVKLHQEPETDVPDISVK